MAEEDLSIPEMGPLESSPPPARAARTSWKWAIVYGLCSAIFFYTILAMGTHHLHPPKGVNVLSRTTIGWWAFGIGIAGTLARHWPTQMFFIWLGVLFFRFFTPAEEHGPYEFFLILTSGIMIIVAYTICFHERKPRDAAEDEG